MKKYFNKISLLLLSSPALLYTSCEVEPLQDPNNPSAEAIVLNASLSEIQNLVDGTEAVLRDNMYFYYDDVGMIGREYYRLQGSDPRVTSDLLGKGDVQLDNNTFYITNPYGSRYRAIKNANILISGLTSAKAISDAERKAGIAYAKTVQAYQYLLVLNLLNNNGIRIDVKDPDKLGPFVNREESLNAIMNLLNEAAADLKSATVFPFSTTLHPAVLTGSARVNATDPFLKFNRALAARVAVYKQDWAAASTALAESFLDLNGDFKAGAYNLVSLAGGDLVNQVFFPTNSPQTETRVAHPSFITEAEAGDNRVAAKTFKRTSTATLDGLSSDYDLYIYKSNTDPYPIIRNEELILIYAEVKAQQGAATEAITAINKIRKAAGLADYTGATDKNSLTTQILKQRRYSLFGEGHRWVDMRRYDLLSQLPIDRPNDDVWTEFPIPANE